MQKRLVSYRASTPHGQSQGTALERTDEELFIVGSMGARREHDLDGHLGDAVLGRKGDQGSSLDQRRDDELR
jgi:hypothetical protein